MEVPALRFVSSVEQVLQPGAYLVVVEGKGNGGSYVLDARLTPERLVEVISPDDRPGEIQAKVREWIEAGVPLVWLLYPRTRTVVVIRSLLDREELTAEDTIDGGDVLPGFSCPVADLFE